jgi:hypothetical protein
MQLVQGSVWYNVRVLVILLTDNEATANALHVRLDRKTKDQTQPFFKIGAI